MKKITYLAATLLLAFAAAGCGDSEAGAGAPISPAPATPGATESNGVRPGTPGAPAVAPGTHPDTGNAESGSRPGTGP